MSLINQMLKDLAKRKTVTNPDMILARIVSKQAKIENPLFYLKYLGILGILLTLLIMIWISHYSKAKAVSILAVPSFEAESRIVAAGEKNSENINETEIQNYKVQENANSSEFVIQLSKPVLYHLKNSNSNELIIQLENSKLTTPERDIASILFEKISIEKKDNDTFFKFKLANHAELVMVNTTQSNANTILSLQFKNNPRVIQDNTLNGGKRLEVSSQVKVNSLDSTKEDRYRKIISEFNHHDIQKSLTDLRSLLSTYPFFIEARLTLAALLIKQGELLEAKAIIEEGLKLRPLFSSLLQLKAEALLAEGAVNESLQTLRLNVPSMEENPEFHALMAALYQRTGKPIMAEKLYEELLLIQPENAFWWLGLGIARDTLNKKSDAYLAYTKALQDSKSLNPETKVFLEKRMSQLA